MTFNDFRIVQLFNFCDHCNRRDKISSAFAAFAHFAPLIEFDYVKFYHLLYCRTYFSVTKNYKNSIINTWKHKSLKYIFDVVKDYQCFKVNNVLQFLLIISNFQVSYLSDSVALRQLFGGIPRDFTCTLVWHEGRQQHKEQVLLVSAENNY